MRLLWRRLLRFFGLVIAFSFALTFISLVYKRVESSNTRIPELPCIQQIFRIPQNVTVFGFPLGFLFRTDGIRMIGCGPIVGTFSAYSFCIVKFTADASFYALIMLPLFFLTHLAMKKRVSPTRSLNPTFSVWEPNFFRKPAGRPTLANALLKHALAHPLFIGAS